MPRGKLHLKLEWLTLMPDASNLEQVLEGPHGSLQSWALRLVPETAAAHLQTWSGNATLML